MLISGLLNFLCTGEIYLNLYAYIHICLHCVHVYRISFCSQENPKSQTTLTYQGSQRLNQQLRILNRANLDSLHFSLFCCFVCFFLLKACSTVLFDGLASVDDVQKLHQHDL